MLPPFLIYRLSEDANQSSSMAELARKALSKGGFRGLANGEVPLYCRLWLSVEERRYE